MIPFGLGAWAIKHGVSLAALHELAVIVGMDTDAPVNADQPAHSEAWVQAKVRLDAPARSMRLWRNNIGVLEDQTGRPVRFGLANDTPQLNKTIKSGDLIGWRRVTIGAEHVGQVIAQFVSLECKKVGWYYTGADREPAQAKWAGLVNSEGGHARFTTGPE